MAANTKVVTAPEMAALEAEAVRHGVSLDTLMENAGLAVARFARQRLGGIAGRQVVVLVGPGNNGSDGLVAGRHLRRWGAEVTACLLTLRPEPDPKLELARQYGVAILDLADDAKMDQFGGLLARSHLVIDAVLGTGRSRPLQGVVREALQRVANFRLLDQDRPLLLALDLPSGLACDTGAVDDATPPADITLALGFPKVGHLSFPGAHQVGELVVLDIGLPQAVPRDHIPLEMITAEWVASCLPPRPLEAHKGTFGHLLVVAGSRNYVGAAMLAARAAHRAGAGLVTLATPNSIYPLVAGSLTETIHLPLPEDALGCLHPDAASVVREALPRYDALAIGSGMGRSPGALQFVEQLLVDGPPLSLPVLVDADGLNNLAQIPRWWERRSGPLVLTPHPGEMATLTGTSTSAVQSDRVGQARRYAARWQAVVVLKGAHTAIATPGEKSDTSLGQKGLVRLAPFANPALASGGTGDVLTGVIGSLLAQGLSPFDAASCGVYLHGKAAEIVAANQGVTGVLASEVSEALPAACRQLQTT